MQHMESGGETLTGKGGFDHLLLPVGHESVRGMLKLATAAGAGVAAGRSGQRPWAERRRLRPGLLLDISKGLLRLNLQVHRTEAVVVGERSVSVWRCDYLEKTETDREKISAVLSVRVSLSFIYFCSLLQGLTIILFFFPRRRFWRLTTMTVRRSLRSKD